MTLYFPGLFLIATGASFEHIGVQSVTPGSPAAAAGVRPDDEVLLVDGRGASG
jgi:S1-C subfamily serine protease